MTVSSVLCDEENETVVEKWRAKDDQAKAERCGRGDWMDFLICTMSGGYLNVCYFTLPRGCFPV
jgi:hypothetical protein